MGFCLCPENTFKSISCPFKKEGMEGTWIETAQFNFLLTKVSLNIISPAFRFPSLVFINLTYTVVFEN